MLHELSDAIHNHVLSIESIEGALHASTTAWETRQGHTSRNKTRKKQKQQERRKEREDEKLLRREQKRRCNKNRKKKKTTKQTKNEETTDEAEQYPDKGNKEHRSNTTRKHCRN